MHYLFSSEGTRLQLWIVNAVLKRRLLAGCHALRLSIKLVFAWTMTCLRSTACHPADYFLRHKHRSIDSRDA